MTTYILVDGENVDWVLGGIVGHRPNPDERPRWERVKVFAEQWGDGAARALFFLNVTTGEIPMPFVQALQAVGFVPLPLSGDGKVVDIALERTLGALERRPGDVLVLSHDGDFSDAIARLLGNGRKVGVLGFPERMSQHLRGLRERGLELFDLEDDANVFQEHVRLDRLRPIPIDLYDPERYL